MWSHNSLRRVLIIRSQCAFIRGARGRTFQDVHRLRLKDGVEGGGVLAVSVAKEEAQRVEACAEVGGEIARLLHGPILRRVGGDTGDVQPSCACSRKASA